MAKRSDAEYAEMSEDFERGNYTVRGEIWISPGFHINAAHREYNNSPKLQELLNSAMNSPTVRRKRRRRSL